VRYDLPQDEGPKAVVEEEEEVAVVVTTKDVEDEVPPLVVEGRAVQW
jgi:hypothetical protein